MWWGCPVWGVCTAVYGVGVTVVLVMGLGGMEMCYGLYIGWWIGLLLSETLAQLRVWKGVFRTGKIGHESLILAS